MKFIEQLVEYLLERRLISKQQRQWLINEGILPEPPEHEYDDDCYGDDFDSTPEYEPVDELFELEEQLVRESATNPTGGSRGGRRKKPSIEKQLNQLAHKMNDLFDIHSPLAKLLGSLATEKTTTTKSLQDAVAFISNVTDEELASKLKHSLKEIALEDLRNFFNTEFESGFRELPNGKVRTAVLGVISGRNYPVSNSIYTKIFAAPEVEALQCFVKLQHRIASCLKAIILNHPELIFVKVPRTYAGCKLIELLMVCRQRELKYIRSIYKGPLVYSLDWNLMKNPEWNDSLQKGWQFAARLFPDTLPGLLHELQDSHCFKIESGELLFGKLLDRLAKRHILIDVPYYENIRSGAGFDCSAEFQRLLKDPCTCIRELLSQPEHLISIYKAKLVSLDVLFPEIVEAIRSNDANRSNDLDILHQAFREFTARFERIIPNFETVLADILSKLHSGLLGKLLFSVIRQAEYSDYPTLSLKHASLLVVHKSPAILNCIPSSGLVTLLESRDPQVRDLAAKY